MGDIAVICIWILLGDKTATPHLLSVNIMPNNVTFLMIFAVVSSVPVDIMDKPHFLQIFNNFPFYCLCIADSGGGGTSSSSGAAPSDNPPITTSAHVGYQGSRRTAHRGRGTYRGRGSGRMPPGVWSGPTLQYLHFGTTLH